MFQFRFFFDQFEAGAEAAIRFLENPASARNRAAAFTKRVIQGYFKKQSGPGGVQWAPISPSWKRQKQRLGFSTQILVMRGDLEASIETEVTGRQIETYTDEPHATRLDAGDPGANLPARPFMDLGAADRSTVGEIYLNELEEAWY